MKLFVRCLSCSCLLLAHLLGARAQNTVQSSANILKNTSLVPTVEFIENKGQVADQYHRPIPEVLYTTESRGVRINFTAQGMQFIFSRICKDSSRSDSNNIFGSSIGGISNASESDSIKFFRLDLAFAGANISPQVEAVEQTDDYTNYYLPQCPNGILHVPAYRRIIYHDLYPKIDMVLYSKAGTQSLFEYDFIVHPGGNPSQIRMQFINPDSLRIDNHGDVTVSTMLGYLQDHAPYAYIAGSEIPVSSHFIVEGHTLRFVTTSYDGSKTLVIDPPRLWGTYYGGPTSDNINDVTVDKDDNIIAAGTSQSASGISSSGAYQTTLGGSQDAFIVKLSPSGNRLWATYYGGSGSEQGFTVIADQSGNIYLGGITGSASGIATTGAFQTTPGTSFLVKFDPTGSRVWGTYYGRNGGNTQIIGLAIDSSSNTYMTGATGDLTGIATAGTYQTSIVSGSLAGFLTSFSPAGTRRWGTYYSGVRPQHSGTGFLNFIKVQVALNGDVVIGGTTQDTSGIATTGTYDTLFPGTGSNNAGFVARFNASGQRIWATYLADTNRVNLAQNTVVIGIACDRDIGVVVGGATNVSRFSTPGAFQNYTSGGNQTGFLMRLDSLGQQVWGTYYQYTIPKGIALDKSYDLVIGGYTITTTGVASPGEYQTTYGGGLTDAFMAKFTTAGAFHWGTYYGGTGTDGAFGFTLDREGHPIIAGSTTSTSAIASSGSFLSTYPSGSSQSGFIAKFCDTVHAPLFFSNRSKEICYGDNDTIIAGAGFQSYQWRQDGTLLTNVTGNRLVLPALTPGTYRFTVQVVDPDACANTIDTLPIVVRALPIDSFGHDTSVCYGSGIRIGNTATGAGPPFIYSWTPIVGLDHPDSARPLAMPLTTTKYFVIVTDTNGCQSMDSVLVHVNAVPQLNAGGNKAICSGSSIRIGGNATLGTAPYTYHWSPKAGLSDTAQPIVTASPASTTKYFLTVTDQNGCQAVDSVLVTVNALPILPPFSDLQICPGTSVVIGAAATSGKAPVSYLWTPAAGLNDPTKATPIARPNVTTRYTVTATDSNGCSTTGSVTVTVLVPPSPSIAANHSTLYCSNDSATLTANATYASYRWSNGSTLPSIVVGPGIYTLTVTDTNGCSGTTAAVVIIQNAPPPAVIVGPTSECPNSSGIYTSPDDSISSYAWTLSGGGTITSGQGTSKLSVNWLTTGSYQLSLREKMIQGSCERDGTVTVTVDNDLHPHIALSSPSVVCTGDTIVLKADSGYSSYSWSSGETTPIVRVAASGDYAVSVTNNAGCKGTSAITHVTVLPDSVPRPVLTSSRTTICVGDSVELKTTKLYSSYLWSTGATTPSLFVSKAAAYSVTVTNSVGCSGVSQPLSFQMVAKPNVQVIPLSQTTFCNGDSVILTATPGYRYTWFNNAAPLPDTTATLIVKSAGNYFVNVVNAAGCDTSTDPIAVIVKSRPHTAVIGPSSICLKGIAGYKAPVSSGSTLFWQVIPPSLGSIIQGQGTDSVNVQWGGQGNGTLQVTVITDGCDSTASLAVTIDTELSPTISANRPLAICAGDSVSLDGGAGYASYQWSKDGTVLAASVNEFLTTSQSGDYSVYVTNAIGCTGSSQRVHVTVHSLPVKPVITRNGNQLTSTAAPHYSWTLNGVSLPDTTQTIAALQDGKYIVTVIDSNGCASASDPLAFSNTGRADVSLGAGIRANPGDPVRVPLTLVSSSDLLEAGATSYTARIHFNASLLAPQGLSSLGIVANGDRIITIGGPLIQKVGLLQNLNFVATLGNDSCTDLVLDTFYFSGANVNVTRENGDFCLSGICMQDGHARLINPDAIVSLSEARPNPAYNTVEIQYHLAEQGPTRLYFEDLLGRTAMMVRNEIMLPGAYRESVSLTSLASGSYRYFLVTPSQVLCRRVEVVK